ncbi:transposase [Sinomicrobium soli]|nr:transposase [Sinomicrobium sp. N-1-3-6]
MGLGKINTKGLRQANKCMHLSAIAYNLKKYLKFTQKRVKSGAGIVSRYFSLKIDPYRLKNWFLPLVNSPLY